MGWIIAGAVILFVLLVLILIPKAVRPYAKKANWGKGFYRLYVIFSTFISIFVGFFVAIDSETANGFLFYADGKVENSTIYTGDVKTVGADVAEFYDADKKYNIGDVLEIGGEKEVTLYNGGPLAGVVSEKPNIYNKQGELIKENN